MAVSWHRETKKHLSMWPHVRQEIHVENHAIEEGYNSRTGQLREVFVAFAMQSNSDSVSFDGTAGIAILSKSMSILLIFQTSSGITKMTMPCHSRILRRKVLRTDIVEESIR